MKKILFYLMAVAGMISVASTSCKKKNPVVELRTAQGSILIELYTEQAPITAGNFLKLVREGVYGGGTFYRTVRGSQNDPNPVPIQVLQGGIQGKEGADGIPRIAHETTDQTGIRHLDGVVSMARSQPGSASTEFFICIGDQPELDIRGQRNPDGQGFAAFGKVIEGSDVVRKIWGGMAAHQILDPPVAILEAKVR